MKLEFVGGGPWDGRVEPVSNIELRIPCDTPILPTHSLPISAMPSLPYHLYKRARAVCPDGCCEELVMQYEGVR